MFQNQYGPAFVEPGAETPETPSVQQAVPEPVAGAHVWLVIRLDLQDDPKIVLPTKDAAENWIRDLHPTLKFSGINRRGEFTARAPETNFAKYRIVRLPFGQPL